MAVGALKILNIEKIPIPSRIYSIVQQSSLRHSKSMDCSNSLLSPNQVSRPSMHEPGIPQNNSCAPDCSLNKAFQACRAASSLAFSPRNRQLSHALGFRSTDSLSSYSRSINPQYWEIWFDFRGTYNKPEPFPSSGQKPVAT